MNDVGVFRSMFRPAFGVFFFFGLMLGCRSSSSNANSVAQMPAPIDAGAAPTPIDAGTSRVPFALTMNDADHGWAIFVDAKQATLERTDTGAMSWNVIRTVGSYEDDMNFGIGAAFLDRVHVVLALTEVDEWDDGNESAHIRIERTDDAGKTWKVTHLVAPQPVMHGLKLTFSSPRDGFLQAIVMSGMSSPPNFGPTWTTHDGGTTWRLGPTLNTSGYYSDCSTCEAILNVPLKLPSPFKCSTVYHTDSDSKLSADLVLEQTPQGDANGNEILTARCPDQAADAGPGNTEGLALFVRRHGKAAWTFSSMQPEDASILFLKPDLFLRTTDTRFDASNDGGKTWHSAALFDAFKKTPSFQLFEVVPQFVSEKIGFVLLPRQWLARTDDGGATWREP